MNSEMVEGTEGGRGFLLRPVFQKLGLEWLPRLLHQPRRLWARTVISAPVFLFLVLKQKFMLR